MSNIKIARRYATALFLNAQEGKEEVLLNEVKELEKIISDNVSLSSLLKDKSIDSITKRNTLDKLFKDSSQIIKNTINLVCEKRREDILEDIIAEFFHIYDDSHNRVKVTITSALPIDNATKDSISKLVVEKTGAKEIEFENIIDKSIIGGFVVRFGDLLVDSSISGQLNKIKKEFKTA